MNRIMLTPEDFAALIRGKIVQQNGMQIALQDIGSFAMIDEIEKAQMEGNHIPDRFQ